MENNKLNNTDYLNDVFKMLLINDLELTLCKNYIGLFCEFISSNPDFKYNSTYLTDSIEVFLSALTDIRQKIAAYKKIVSKIKRQIGPEKDVTIIFDEFCEYKIKDSPIEPFKIVYAGIFRFDKITKDDCIIRFICRIDDSIMKNEVYRINLKDKKKFDSLWEDFKMTIEKL